MIPHQPESVSMLWSLGVLVVGAGLIAHALLSGRKRK